LSQSASNNYTAQPTTPAQAQATPIHNSNVQTNNNSKEMTVKLEEEEREGQNKT
jgi:hypothetical protein